MSARRTAAETTLSGLGLAPEALASGAVPAERLREILRGPDGAAVAAALGEIATAEGAALLVALEPEVAERATRKAIRRALYRIGQRGVHLPSRPAEPEPPRASGFDPEGLVSAFDGRGDRLVWLVRPLPSGATLLVAAQVNEPGGMRDLQVHEITRKQLRATRRRLAEDAAVHLVPGPWRVLDALLVEATERSAVADEKRDYRRVRPRLTDDPPAPPAEPVSSRLAPPDAEEAAQLVAASAALLQEPELRTWWPSPEQAAPFLAEMTALRDSPLVLSQAQSEERLREIADRAVRALYPAASVARRLEGTAYVLAERGRTAEGRIALAVAGALRARPEAAAEVPLIANLVHHGLGTMLAAAERERQAEREAALVVTPGEVLRARSSSRPPRTRA